MLAPDATVVQLVAFSNASVQLPLFLKSMNEAGYQEVNHDSANRSLVRDVPNRRWYARGKEYDAAREHLIILRPRP
jgi:hypothetical protein